jgi:hypothetical protein
MSSVTYVGTRLKAILEEDAKRLARETGCIKRERKFNGADLVQTLVFGWQGQPEASLEQLASLAQEREVSVSDSAMHKRFTPECARFLHAILEEMTQVVVQAPQLVPLPLLRRFSAVILEDSSTITLPNALAEIWQGCGGNQDHTAAAVKVHVRWDLQRGQLWGPTLSDGRRSDHASPFNERQEQVPAGSLSIEDLGYFGLRRLAQRRARGAYSLTRYKVGTVLLSPQGQRIQLSRLLPRRVGQLKEVHVLVGAHARLPMRLLMLRVPKAVGDERREQLRVDAQRRGQPLSAEALELAEWTILLTDVPAKRLRFEEALVLLRERWQMELLYKLWKQEGQVDEWRTANRWRVLCELYAKLIGAVLQHWLMVLFAWQDPQRSLVKLAQVVRQTSWTLIRVLAGRGSMRSALQRIGRRMQSGCRMNTRQKRPNSAQLIERQGVEWALSWCE